MNTEEQKLKRKAYMAEYYKDRDNRDRVNARRRERYANDPEYKAMRLIREPEANRRCSEAWRKKNLGRAAGNQAKRRSAKLERTPEWNDDLVMRMIYEDCPEGHHVDHIVPLQGETVSGLHVHYNLQYLTAEENIRKSNKWQ